MATAKSNAARLSVAMRRARAIQMKIDGIKVPEIMTTLGYRSTAAVYQDIGRALTAFVGQPANELVAIDVARMDDALVRLNEMEVKVRAVRDRDHLTVSHGRVITVPDPNDETKQIPLLDDGPVLQATVQLLNIEKQRGDVQTRRAKLLGLNAPDKVQVITDEVLDEELAKAQAAVADLERALAAEDAEPEGDPEAAG